MSTVENSNSYKPKSLAVVAIADEDKGRWRG